MQTNLTDRDTVSQLETTGINQRKITPVPVGVAIQTITRGPWHILNNSEPLANHAIKKCGFANVWPPHNSY
jgi:hypothetical protein